MKFLIFSTFLLLIFSACEKTTSIHFQFKNDSNSPIILNGHDLIHNWAIQDTILVGEEKTISSWSKFGKELSYFSPVDFFGDDFLVINMQGDTLKKDYKDLENWQIVIDEERSVAIHDYLLEMETTDFN
jgi:hypothetical protein